jgi:hypothetical protein
VELFTRNHQDSTPKANKQEALIAYFINVFQAFPSLMNLV